MSGDRKLSHAEVEAMRDALGRDLRTDEAAARRARASAIEAKARASPPSHRLPPVGSGREEVPPVGHHTEVLEHTNPYSEAAKASEGSGHFGGGHVNLRRPSTDEAPDMKKPKLEPSDVDMHNPVSPGEPILSATAEDSQDHDVDIPKLDQADSPSFASQAVNIPPTNAFKELRLPQHIDLTEQDEMVKETGFDDDELSQASQQPHPAAGILRVLNSEFKEHKNSGSGEGSDAHSAPLPSVSGANSGLFNSGIHNSNPPPPPPAGLYQAPQQMPPWLADIHQGLQSLHNKADKQYHEISTCLHKGPGSFILSRLALSILHSNRNMKSKSNNLSPKSKNYRLLCKMGPGPLEELRAHLDHLDLPDPRDSSTKPEMMKKSLTLTLSLEVGLTPVETT